MQSRPGSRSPSTTHNMHIGSGHRLRETAAAAIEQLISFVDDLDGDADLEDAGDMEEAGDAEPSLGAGNEDAQTRWAMGARDDREDEHDGREADVDDELSGDEDEPSLGSFDRMINQDHGWRQTQGRNWAAHQNSDREAEPHTA